jgi:hypothetical protein
MADNPVNQYLAFSGFYGPNPYSQYQNQALSLPRYVGTPTDAMGNPIAGGPTPGTTLNSQPAAAPPAAPANNMNQLGGTLAQKQAYNSVRGLGGQAELGGATQVGYDPSGKQLPYPVANPAYTAAQMGQNQPQAAQQGDGGGGAPGTMDWQTALSMLANPGKVTTPGANGPSSVPQSNVLQQFLANNQGGTGAGNYSNQGFFNTLNALKGGGGGSAPPIDAPPAQGQPGTAFSRPPTFGSGGSIGGGPTNTNSLAGYSNTPPGTDPFANAGAFRRAQGGG